MAASAHRKLVHLLAVAVTLVAGACSPPVGPTPTGTMRPIVILQHHSGDDLTTAERVMLVNSRAELDALGHDTLAKLDVDFQSQSLLIVTLGEKPTSGWWVRIDSAQLDGTGLYFQGIANAPDRTQAVASVLTYPYAAAVISKVGDVRLHPEIDSVQGKAPHAR